jgi:hypothetical protein
VLPTRVPAGSGGEADTGYAFDLLSVLLIGGGLVLMVAGGLALRRDRRT